MRNPQVLPAGLVPVGQAYQRQIAMGRMHGGGMGSAGAAAMKRAQQGGGRSGPEPHSEAEFDPRFEKIPAQYVVTILLGGAVGNAQPGSAQLRPEPFLLKRITWAAQGDTFPFADTFPGWSIQGRAVTMSWNDEFTQFMGNTPGLIASVLGDSQGFLDLPRPALFQGSQNLTINLTRVSWPADTTPATTRFDFTFQGLGLLPKGVAQSGSAG
jgi:hypothetical protein